MPVRGAILILVLAVLFAFVFRNEIYGAIKSLHEEEDKNEETEVKENEE